MDRLHPGEIVGEEGRDHQLQEHTGARMEQPQQPRHGEAAPRPLLRRLAERVLEGRGIGHGASRAIDEKRAMTMPPPFVQGGSLHGAAEALEEEGEEAQREFGTGLTVGRRTEPQARQMGQMAAGGVAMQNLQQEELDGGDRREHPVAPCDIPHLAARGEDGFGLQQGMAHSRREALEDGSNIRDHGVTSCMRGI